MMLLLILGVHGIEAVPGYATCSAEYWDVATALGEMASDDGDDYSFKCQMGCYCDNEVANMFSEFCKETGTLSTGEEVDFLKGGAIPGSTPESSDYGLCTDEWKDTTYVKATLTLDVTEIMSESLGTNGPLGMIMCDSCSKTARHGYGYYRRRQASVSCGSVGQGAFCAAISSLRRRRVFDWCTVSRRQEAPARRRGYGLGYRGYGIYRFGVGYGYPYGGYGYGRYGYYGRRRSDTTTEPESTTVEPEESSSTFQLTYELELTYTEFEELTTMLNDNNMEFRVAFASELQSILSGEEGDDSTIPESTLQVTAETLYLQSGEENTMTVAAELDSEPESEDEVFSNEAFVICIFVFLLLIGIGVGYCTAMCVIKKRSHRDEKMTSEIVRKVSEEMERRASDEEYARDETTVKPMHGDSTTRGGPAV